MIDLITEQNPFSSIRFRMTLATIPLLVVICAFGSASGQDGGGSGGDPDGFGIVVMPEEYQLRVLEEQIQMLRHKLYFKQKMSDKEKAAWAKQYKGVATRLQSWNKFTDEYDIE